MNETGEFGRESESSTAPPGAGGASAPPSSTGGVTWGGGEPGDVGLDDDGSGKKGGRNTWKWVALVLLVLAGIVVLLVLTRSDTVKVPDVNNLTVDSATASLRAVGLDVGEVNYTNDVESGVEPGKVAGQNPQPGTKVKSGSQVDLDVAAPAEVEVPNVVGLDLVEATEILQRYGLAVEFQEKQQAGATAGAVVEQSPAGGTKVALGSTVTLMVAPGRTESSVPDVVGATQSAATTRLKAAGFAVKVDETYDSQADQGIVISQSPKAGVTAAVGETVTIVVSKGKSPEVSVPNVVGLTESDGVGQLQSAGLKIGLSDAYSNTVAAGSIISQNPAGGTNVAQGSLVTIVVSLGAEPPATATVPDVMGQTESAAESALEGAGFTVVKTRVYSDSTPTGTVGWQLPTGGSMTQPGSTVGIIVSGGPRPPQFVIVPDVSNLTVDDAYDTLQHEGLVAEIIEVYTNLAPQGKIVGQVPEAGSAVAQGWTVVLVVSKGSISDAPK